MKNIKILFLAISSLTLFNCSTANTISTKDGSAMENAIKVSDVSEEYQIVRSKCVDCKLKGQGLIFNDKGKPFDVLTFNKSNGEEVNYYFDISKFYGKF
jgi:hypothetical protein